MTAPRLIELDHRWASQIAVWDSLIFGPDAFSVTEIEESYKHPFNCYYGLDVSGVEDLSGHFDGFETAVAAKDDVDAGRAELAGYVSIRLSSGECEILSFGLLPQYRGRGLGLILGERILRLVRGKGVHTVFLEVRETNAPALGLYKRLGFEEIARRKHYYRHPRETAIVMCLRLAPPAPGPVGRETIQS